MDTGLSEQIRYVTSTAIDIAVRLLQLQSDINDNDSLPQYNAHADMAPSSILDNRRAETSQQLRLYEPNCGYNYLNPRHSQPNLSSAITHNYSESNEHPTNRQDVFT